MKTKRKSGAGPIHREAAKVLRDPKASRNAKSLAMITVSRPEPLGRVRFARRWFIVDRVGGLMLGGNTRTRLQAIRDHIQACEGIGPGSEPIYSRKPLTRAEAEQWARCRRDGERAVAAVVSWDHAQ